MMPLSEGETLYPWVTEITSDRLPGAGYSRRMGLRSTRQRAAGLRALCVLILLLFLLVCGIHIAGAHHDPGPDGLALADGLTDVVLLVLLLVAVAAGSGRMLCGAGKARAPAIAPSAAFSLGAAACPGVVPLRC
jgi:Na+-driven multidrug efflux pump